MPRIPLSPEYNLAVKFPEVAAQWHPTKNGDLTPENVTPGSPKKRRRKIHKNKGIKRRST